MRSIRRLLLGSSAGILAVGGFMHAAAFRRALSAVAATNLGSFYVQSFKALWLIDSATLFTLAIIFGLAAARPSAVSRAVMILLACIPASTAFFQYLFLGAFVPAHMLLLAAVAAFFGAFASTDAPSVRSAGGVVGLLLIMLGTIMCDGVAFNVETFPYPVGTEAEAVFDAGLVGVWRSASPDDDIPVELVIKSPDGRTFDVSMREVDDDLALEMRAFVVDAGGLRVLNGRLVRLSGVGVSGYMLYRYQLEVPDGLILTPLESEGWEERGVMSAETLLEHLKAHWQDVTLYGEPIRYRRVSLWGAVISSETCVRRDGKEPT